MRAAAFLLIALSATTAFAHKASDSYLSLASSGQRIDGSWEIALRDLEEAVGLDDDGDGAITWAELARHQPDVFGYALARLRVSSAAGACRARPSQLLVDDHSDGAYAVLRFSLDCPVPADKLEVGYSLLFELDPSHRGILRFEAQGRIHRAIFSPARAVQQVGTADGQRGPLGLVGEGILSVWSWPGHVLFLLGLLLPLVLRRRGGRRQPAPLREMVPMVGSFAIAHSITLSLAALGFWRMPGRLVVPAMALSVVLAAASSLLPLFRKRLWLVAFVCGLLHGFGFAGALLERELSGVALLPALLSFNLGIELGILLLVGILAAAAQRLRATIARRAESSVAGLGLSRPG